MCLAYNCEEKAAHDNSSVFLQTQLGMMAKGSTCTCTFTLSPFRLIKIGFLPKGLSPVSQPSSAGKSFGAKPKEKLFFVLCVCVH